MSKYLIPDQFLSGFEIISKTEKNNIEGIASEIKIFPVGIGPNAFSENLEKKFKFEGIQKFASAIFSLGSLLVSNEDSLDTLSKDLSSSYKNQIGESFSEENRVDLEEKLIILLTCCGNLKTNFKALSLLSENDNVFRSSRLVSDIRLVFKDNLNDENRNALIIHRLKIEFMKDGKSSEIFFSLDSSDLNKFREQIERAIEKDKIIRKSYNDKLSFIDLND